MANDSEVSLLFKLKADTSEAAAGAAIVKTAVAGMRSTWAAELSAMQQVSGTALGGISEKITTLAANRIPLAGTAVSNLTSTLRGMGSEATNLAPRIASIQEKLSGLANTKGVKKSQEEIAGFLQTFSRLGSEIERRKAAFEFFGNFTGAKLLPALKDTATEMEVLAQETATTTSSMAGLAGPMGIVVVVALAQAVAIVGLGKALYDATIATAEFRGSLFDLSQQTGVSVETLSALRILATTTGSDLGSLSASLGIFQKHLEDGADPASKMGQLLKSLGINTNNTEEAFRQTFAVLGRMPEGFKQTALALELFGRGGKSILAIIKETNGNLDEAMAKFRELGLIVSTEDAVAADKLNDQLALLNLQIQAVTGKLVGFLIPLIRDLASQTSEFIAKNPAALRFLEGVVLSVGATFVSVFKTMLVTTEEFASAAKKVYDLATRGLILYETGLQGSTIEQDIATVAVVAYTQGLDKALEALIALHEEQGRAPKPAEVTGGAAGDKGTEQLAQETQANLTTIDNAAKEAQQIAQNMMTGFDLDFQKGQTTRRDQINKTIAVIIENERVQQEAIESRIALLEKQKVTTTDLQGIEKQIDDARSTARIQRRQRDIDVEKLRTQLVVDETKGRIQAIQQEAAAYVKLNANNIKLVENARAAFEIDDLKALAETKVLTEKRFAVQEAALQKELKLVGKNEDDKKRITAELASVDSERDSTRIEQAEQLRQIRLKLSLDSVEQEKTRVDALVQLAEISSAAQIASTEAAGKAGLATLEDTAARIGALKLEMIDFLVEAAKARRTAAGTIQDPRERAKAVAAVDAEIKVLGARRVAQEAQNSRDIADGQAADLQRYIEYQQALTDAAEDAAKERREIADIDREILIANRGSRLAIVAQNRALAIADLESDRARAVGRLASEKREALDSLKTRKSTAEEKLAVLRVFEQRELQTKEEFDKRKQLIETRAAREAALAGPGGGFATGLESGQLAELENGVQNFSDVATVAFSAVGVAVNGLAQAVGQLVNNWVLMGETGPAAARKVLASVLASVAQQAAVQAIMCTAYGIAALTPWGAAIFGPAVAWFKAAAVFASVAAVSAVAGRAIAGDSFKNQGAGGGASGGSGGGSGGSGGSSTPSAPAPINLGSQRPLVVHLVVEHKPGPMFDSHIVNTVVNNAETDGAVRRVMVKEIKRQE